MKWERARTEEQKEQRVAEIIQATAKLYARKEFEEITLVSIAKEANFTRSNLYKYFNSKEEIFFEFLKHDIILWRQELVEIFQTTKKCSIKNFASIWLKTQVKHKRMLSLISILYAHLEKKSSLETLIDFKTMVVEEFKTLSALLYELFPKLSLENITKFIQMQLAVSIGLYTMTNLCENQEKVLEYPEFKHFKIDYDVYFQQCIEYLLIGLLNENSD